MNKKCGPSGCPKAGIKIHETQANVIIIKYKPKAIIKTIIKTKVNK